MHEIVLYHNLNRFEKIHLKEWNLQIIIDESMILIYLSINVGTRLMNCGCTLALQFRFKNIAC